MKRLSPKRNTSTATCASELAAEQLAHFNIDPNSNYGQTLLQVVQRMYESQSDVSRLWEVTMASIGDLDDGQRIQYFNAKKFLSFQLAKILDTLQNPFRKTYQELNHTLSTRSAKGPYPVFDNVTALFSATPVITRTATYIYACAEWIEDAFRGKELMLEIYSRLLNPTSVCLANHIVDLECGPYADQYMAWNFNSGMAAIDSTLAHLLGRDDVLITSKHAERLAAGRKIYVYLESPCNPQGYVLDVAGISKVAHQHDLKVILDATVGTPFLVRPLQRENMDERPDYVIHSYTKDLSGCGAVIVLDA